MISKIQLHYSTYIAVVYKLMSEYALVNTCKFNWAYGRWFDQSFCQIFNQDPSSQSVSQD